MPKWTIGSNQHKKTPASPPADLPTRPLTGVDESIQPSLIETRANLISTLELLSPQIEAITLIGSHAVHERTKTLTGVDSTTTKDGDLAVTPELVSDDPSIEAILRDAGFEPRLDASRPGQWFRGTDEQGNETNLIDLLSPEAMAGGKPTNRSVKTLPAGQGKIAVGRAAGIELATKDRDWMELDSLNGDGRAVHAWVAGSAALVCAKTYKLHERISVSGADGRRVQPKDASDLWRLIATTDGAEVRATFDRYADDPVVGPSVTQGIAMVRDLMKGGEVVSLAETNLGNQVAPDRVATDFRRWFEQFTSRD